MSVGKRFEYELKKSFELEHPYAYIERNVDRMYGGKYSTTSPPDLLVNASKFNLLVECKAVKGQSLPFNRMSDHQREYLIKYDKISKKHEGMVAVLYYNGQRGSGRKYEAWLVPIKYWISYENSKPRKSLAKKDLESSLKYLKMEWKSGRWILPEKYKNI